MKHILTSALVLVALQQGMAQVDRSKPPAPGPAPVLNVGTPITYKLPNGMTVLIVENHKLPKVSATLNIDAGPITEGKKAGTLDLMGGMLNEGTTLKTKAQFDEAADKMGANVSVSSSGGFASSLTRYFPQSLALLAEGLRKPSFPEASFDKLKSQTIVGLKSEEKNAKTISTNVTNALAFGTDNPMGEMTTEATVNSITLADVKAAYAKYITPSRSYLTIVGDITPVAAKALVLKTFGDWKGPKLELPTLKKVSNVSETEIDVVDVPNAVQSEIKVTNLIDLPMSSPDYFPVLLANEILGGGASSRLFMNLREKHGFTYGAYSSTGAGRFQTRFTASASVRNEKADSAVAEFISEIKKIREEKVSDQELKDAKAKYNGTFALGMENPARTAGFASTILINGLPADFYKTYLQKINAVSVEDIQRVAQKYYNLKDTRITGVGKAATILPSLKKLGYPVKEYDRNAQPVLENAMAVPSATNVTAKQVIANYIAAIGGEAELKKVTSLSTEGEMQIQGQTLATSGKKLAPNMELMEVKMQGMTAMKSLFDGNTGYQMQMGNKKDMDADEIKEKKSDKVIFPQLYYNEAGYKIEMAGTDKVGSNPVYKINITNPSGTVNTEYYDTKTWYLLKEESTKKAAGQEIATSIEYSDYQKVNNIFFPKSFVVGITTPMGPMELQNKTNTIKINEGVTAADFK